MKKLLLILGLSLGIASSVNSNSLIENILSDKEDEHYTMYLLGVAQGLKQAAIIVKDKDGTCLFNVSRELKLDDGMAFAALEFMFKKYPDLTKKYDKPATMVLYGFQQMFPCP